LASFHLSVHPPVSRGKGQSVVATAAYNGRTRLVDERSGRVWDYRSLGATLFSGIYAPKDAPEWAGDLQRLVSEIERVEKRSDAQLAFNIDIALPHELTLEQSRRLAQDFVREEWQRKGYAVVVDIHAPDPKGDDRNIHMHVWGTLRKLGKDGFAATKAEQQDNYRNRSAYTEYLREKWERLANRHLERAGFDVRIDRRSLQDRGIVDREPEQHRGPELTVIDRDGRESRISGEIRRRREQLAELRRLQAEERQLKAEKARIINLADARAARGETWGGADFENGSSRKRRKMAIEREDATDPKSIQRQIDDQQDFASRAKEQTELSERFLAGVKRAQEDGEKLREAEQWAGMKAAQEDDIADARSRYAQAAGERYDIRRPYSSLSEVVGLEGAMFQREQERLKRETALERDPDRRELLELRQQIEANDYMAITSDRLAAMSRIITGNGNSDESQRQQQRAEYFAAEALDLRQQRQEVQDRIDRRDSDREMQAIDGRIETVRQWQQKQGGGKAASEQDNSASETPREAVQAHQATAAVSQAGQPATRASEAERPSEVIHFGPSVPARETQPTTAARETTDARQVESATAENVEITDVKAAKKAALAQNRAETEQSIAQGQERGSGHSR
jgi:hypothetical protein